MDNNERGSLLRKGRVYVWMLGLLAVSVAALFGVLWLFRTAGADDRAGAGKETAARVSLLTDSICQIVSDYPGEIGVAVIMDGKDVVAVNDTSIFPMMSVFKVHQALAVCEDFDRKGMSLDSVMTFRREELDPNTWSPMLKEHQEPVIRLTVRELLHYTLTRSDNNASNLMFDRLVSVAQTDSFISTVISRQSFRIAYTEAEMSADHDKAYSNSTSPLGAAMLMERLFTDSLLSGEKQEFVKKSLGECLTGKDRIVAPLADKEGVTVAHKTGSGYTNEKGQLAAHNDVAYIMLPDGRHYTLAVFVKDFMGNEEQASLPIARLSAAVYSFLVST